MPLSTSGRVTRFYLFLEQFKMHQNVLVIGLLSLTVTEAWIPRFFHGRHLGGFVPPPPRRPEMQGKPFADEMWFEQTLDHFNDADTRTFMQVCIYI